MNELIDKLILELDNRKEIQNIKESINKISKNNILKEKIKNYNETHDINIKNNILEYEEIIKYKKYENELNYLILEINKKLKEVIK